MSQNNFSTIIKILTVFFFANISVIQKKIYILNMYHIESSLSLGGSQKVTLNDICCSKVLKILAFKFQECGNLSEVIF